MTTNSRQFILFCLIGGVGLIINLLATHIGVTVFKIWYFWSFLCGVLLGWTSSFFLNAFLTFPEHKRESYAEKYSLFIATYAVIFVLNAGMVYVLTSLLSVHYLISITISALTTTLLSFSFSKRVIYIT